MQNKQIVLVIILFLTIGLNRIQAQENIPIISQDTLLYSVSSKNQRGKEPFDSVTSVRDIDGNIYTTLKIGKQIWMTKNLKTTKYNDGTVIPLITDTIWGYLSTPAYCWYNNNEEKYKNIYGALYNWYTINTHKLCPLGWHVPSDNEWETLVYYLGGPYKAGSKLKEVNINSEYWKSPNSGATNSSGFNGLPGGNRNPDGSFSHINIIGMWWTYSEEYNTDDAWGYMLYHNNNGIGRNYGSKKSGLSVRCVKN